MKKALATTAFAVLLGTSSVALTATTAAADIVCNSEGDCWHTTEHFTYPPQATIIVHPDDWKWSGNEKFAFREHEGRGYWHGDKWTTW